MGQHQPGHYDLHRLLGSPSCHGYVVVGGGGVVVVVVVVLCAEGAGVNVSKVRSLNLDRWPVSTVEVGVAGMCVRVVSDAVHEVGGQQGVE